MFDDIQSPTAHDRMEGLWISNGRVAWQVEEYLRHFYTIQTFFIDGEWLRRAYYELPPGWHIVNCPLDCRNWKERKQGYLEYRRGK